MLRDKIDISHGDLSSADSFIVDWKAESPE